MSEGPHAPTGSPTAEPPPPSEETHVPPKRRYRWGWFLVLTVSAAVLLGIVATGLLSGGGTTRRTVSGVVTSALTGAPLKATLAVAGSTPVTTGEDGSFSIRALVPGGVISASAPGYYPSDYKIEDAKKITIVLAPTAATAACAQANTDFDAWVTAYADAAHADQDALSAWLKYDISTGSSMPDPSSPQLLAAISAFTTANNHAHALRKIADQDLATYQADIKACDQSSLPADCKGDFGQHPTLIAIAERMTRADDTMDRYAEARQAAYRVGDASGVDAQAKPYNAASDAFSAASDAWNKANDAHDFAATQCTLSPEGGGTR